MSESDRNDLPNFAFRLVARVSTATGELLGRASSLAPRLTKVATASISYPMGATLGVLAVGKIRRMELSDIQSWLPQILEVFREPMVDQMEAATHYRCNDCELSFRGYMLSDETWSECLTDAERITQESPEGKPFWIHEKDHPMYEALNICPGCVAKRLGRPLHPQDMCAASLADARMTLAGFGLTLEDDGSLYAHSDPPAGSDDEDERPNPADLN